MKFTKTALAVAVALTATAASAQTANVTLYGSIRAAVEVAKYSGAAPSARITSLENVSSRWGLRGSESLGGGINAIFQLESGFGSDTGSIGATNGVSQIFSREAWVGLQGGFGTVKLGYGLTPYDDVLGWAHHQGANSWENRNNGVSGGAGFAKRDLFVNYAPGACNSSAFDARMGNSINYETPNFSGFSVRTQYALLGEAAKKSCTGFDTAVKYSNGPVRVGVTYALHRNFTGIGGAGNTTPSTGFISTPNLHNQDALRGYASFDAGVVKIDATYEVARYKPETGTLKYKYWELGALAPLGAATLGVQYSQRDKGLAAFYNNASQNFAFPTGASAIVLNGATSAATRSVVNNVWDNGGGKHLSFTADYALSKRTLIRSYYTQLKNEGTLLSTGGYGSRAKIDAFSLALWHSF
jgi:predicted porin